MKNILLWSAILVGMACTLLGEGSGSPAREGVPQYTTDNRLMRPEGYREWIYLSSGLGMTYTVSKAERFSNVFVLPSSYQEFLATGKWPDKTVFVVEQRMASSEGSIVKGGRFQTDLGGIGVEVKDESRFPEKWAYFSFGLDAKAAKANPKEACFQCHNEHGAVENTFVQFYPTLKPIAQHFGTYRESVEGTGKNPNSP